MADNRVKLSEQEVSQPPATRKDQAASDADVMSATANGERPTSHRKALIVIIRVAVIVLAVLLWEGLVNAHRIDPFFFGKPSLIGQRFWGDLQSGLFASNVFVTVQETILGLATGVVAGCLLGFLFARYRTMYQALDPIIYALYSLPRITLAPLFVLWFGIGLSSKVALAFSIVFFIMLLNTYTGITTIDRDLVDAVRLMGASQSFIYRMVTLPAIVPWLVAGFRLSASYALLAAIVGEMIGSEAGIGKLLIDREAFFDTNGIFDILIVVGLMAILINSLAKAAEKRFSRWNLDVSVTE
jgi:NitT/TauT family transport system permease protein